MKLAIEESVLRQALEALCYMWNEDEIHPDTKERITALLTALEAAENVEPVAWLYKDTYGKLKVSQIEEHDEHDFPVFTNPAPAVPKVGAAEKVEHDQKDVRCECCGYMTYHREHLGCIRAARPAPAVPEIPAGATHYQPHQKTYYKRVSATEWYLWSCTGKGWIESKGTGDSAEWVMLNPVAAPTPPTNTAALAKLGADKTVDA